MNKVGLAILLLFSMSFLLYPSVTALIDLQNVINEYGRYVPQESIKTRDNLILQILGYIFLYVFLGAELYYYGKQPNQQSTPNNSEENEPLIQVKQVPSLSPKTSDRIFIFSALTFFIVFLGQYFTTNSTYGRLDPIRMVIFPMFYGLIAACVVGIVLYLIVKYRIVEIER